MDDKEHHNRVVEVEGSNLGHDRSQEEDKIAHDKEEVHDNLVHDRGQDEDNIDHEEDVHGKQAEEDGNTGHDWEKHSDYQAVVDKFHAQIE